MSVFLPVFVLKQKTLTTEYWEVDHILSAKEILEEIGGVKVYKYSDYRFFVLYPKTKRKVPEYELRSAKMLRELMSKCKKKQRLQIYIIRYTEDAPDFIARGDSLIDQIISWAT